MKNILATTGLVAALMATPALAQDKNKDPNTCKLQGSVYGEVANFSGDYEGNPWFVNMDLGYNLLNRPSNNSLFLTARGHVGGDNPENFYSHRADAALGIAWRVSGDHAAFQAGVDAGKSFALKEGAVEGTFERAYMAFWAGNSIGRLDGSIYGEAEYNTLEYKPDVNGNGVGFVSGSAFLNAINKPRLKAGAYANVSANADIEDEDWNNWVQGEAGLALRSGPFFLQAGRGKRITLNDRGFEGDYNVVRAGISYRFGGMCK